MDTEGAVDLYACGEICRFILFLSGVQRKLCPWFFVLRAELQSAFLRAKAKQQIACVIGQFRHGRNQLCRAKL